MSQAGIYARVVSALLGAVVVFQAALVAGAPWGQYTQGGVTQGVLQTSGRAMAFSSIIILLIFVLGILGLTGQGPWARKSPKILRRVSLVATVYSAIGVVVNGLSRSHVERNLWTPVTLVCFVLMLRVLRLTPKSN